MEVRCKPKPKKKDRPNPLNVSIRGTFHPRFWEESDGRCFAVKEIRRRYQRLVEHAGGDESYQRDLICQRTAFLSIFLETMEVQAAAGEPIDFGVYTQATNALVGLLKALGLEKRVKQVGGLSQYLSHLNGKERH